MGQHLGLTSIWRPAIGIDRTEDDNSKAQSVERRRYEICSNCIQINSWFFKNLSRSQSTIVAAADNRPMGRPISLEGTGRRGQNARWRHLPNEENDQLAHVAFHSEVSGNFVWIRRKTEIWIFKFLFLKFQKLKELI
jgi:hypothetical protein